MQITINLCTTPYLDVEPILRKLRIALAGLGVLTLIAVMLLVMAHKQATAFVREEGRLDGTILRESGELSSYRAMLERSDTVNVANRALALNSLFAEKSFSWTLILKDFEGLVPAEVQLATIEPLRNKDGSISIRMHVVGPRDKVIELVHGMEGSSAFLSPHVTAETAHTDARAMQHAAPLTSSSVEEFDLEAGCTEIGSGPALPDRSPAARSDTASADPASSLSEASSALLTAKALPARPVRAEGTR